MWLRIGRRRNIPPAKNASGSEADLQCLLSPCMSARCGTWSADYTSLIGGFPLEDQGVGGEKMHSCAMLPGNSLSCLDALTSNPMLCLQGLIPCISMHRKKHTIPWGSGHSHREACRSEYCSLQFSLLHVASKAPCVGFNLTPIRRRNNRGRKSIVVETALSWEWVGSCTACDWLE